MDDENQMGQGPAVPPQAKEEANRGVTHARKGGGRPPLGRRRDGR